VRCLELQALGVDDVDYRRKQRRTFTVEVRIHYEIEEARMGNFRPCRRCVAARLRFLPVRPDIWNIVPERVFYAVFLTRPEMRSALKLFVLNRRTPICPSTDLCSIAIDTTRAITRMRVAGESRKSDFRRCNGACSCKCSCKHRG